MEDLLAARWQMAISLAFHILFAVAGMAMPALMVIAEGRYLRTREHAFRLLAMRWAKGTAILFAVGAVSGTVLSFELGLLWPTFMEHAGPLIGMPFSLEGFAFFLEAIAIGIYLYGWDRVPERVHWLSGVVVALSGLFSGVFVVAVNAWMNAPAGFEVAADGTFQNVNVGAAFGSPAFPSQATHMALAAYCSVAFVVLGIHAGALLKHPESTLHRAALSVVLPVVIVTAPLQALSGDLSAKHIAQHQPAKLAAAEGLFHTQRGAALAIGGFPDEDQRKLNGAIHVPKLLSVLAFADPDSVVQGLDQVPQQDWPPVATVHLSFQLMVGCGMLMLAVAVWALGLKLKKRRLEHSRSFLKVAVLVSPLGLVALEAGWMVTEVGRQPWIIHGVMRVSNALTPMPGLWFSLTISVLVYLVLGSVVLLMLRRYVMHADADKSPAAEPIPAGVSHAR